MAGIEPNPGPITPNCPVCKKIVSWKTKSVFCTKCKAWCHVRKKDNCSGLKNHRDYNNTWKCPPCQQQQSINQPEPELIDFKILQFNCNGLRNKVTEILNWMNKKDIKIAAFQETKLSEKVQLSDLGDFILIRKDRLKDTGGGIAFLIHKNISFQILPNINDEHAEYQAIKINNIQIVNLYIPPTGRVVQLVTYHLSPNSYLHLIL